MNSIEEPLSESEERLFSASPLVEDSLEVRGLGMMTPEAKGFGASLIAGTGGMT
jgi:hypothetical protein